MPSARILFVANAMHPGGAERHTVSLVKALDRARFDSRLALLKSVHPEIPEVSELEDWVVWRAEGRSGVDLRGLLRLIRLVRKFDPTVIVCANQYPLMYGYLARRLAGSRAPLAFVFHTTELPDAKSRRLFRLYRLLANRVERIVYVCENQRRHWQARGLRDDTAAVIHNGIDQRFLSYTQPDDERARLRTSLGFGADDVVVGLCAALRREKAHVDLLHAIAALRSRGLPYGALLIGDGACRGEIEAKSHELGLGNAVRITGYLRDVRAHVQACDIMTLVSHTVETFSLASLEAMAMGRPMVLSDVGGASEQVEDGINGYLFPKGDIDALVDRLSRLRDADVRKPMGEAGRDRVQERFTFDAMVQKYEQLLEELQTAPAGDGRDTRNQMP